MGDKIKSRTFTLSHMTDKQSLFNYLKDIVPDGSHEVVVRKAKIGKTKQQLGGLFGVWVEDISDDTGLTQAEVHQQLKRNFLARIYCECPDGDIQEMWVDHLFDLQERQDWEAVRRHADRISLSWASLTQTRIYMDRVQQYYISVGKPLRVLSPEQVEAYYRGEKRNG